MKHNTTNIIFTINPTFNHLTVTNVNARFVKDKGTTFCRKWTVVLEDLLSNTDSAI